MTEIEQMVQRAKIEIMTRDFSKDEQKQIMKDIEDFKNIAKVDNISDEMIALFIFLFKKKQ